VWQIGNLTCVRLLMHHLQSMWSRLAKAGETAAKIAAIAFADKLGFDGRQRRVTVYRWEAGLRTPSAPVMKMLEKIAKAKRSARPEPDSRVQS
jgi:hypothetical protein